MRLSRVDELDLPNRPSLERDDECYYLREFTSRKGFDYSETNQLIYNLKKKPSSRGSPGYHYKTRAVQQCIVELRTALNLPAALPALAQWTLVPMPPSKTVDHPDYDDRMEQIVRGLVAGGPDIDVRLLLRQRESMAAAHESDVRPTVVELLAMYEVVPQQQPLRANGIILCDDVLTQGTHFRAAKTILRTAYPGLRVVGVFVAKAVRELDPVSEVVRAYFASKKADDDGE